MTQQVDSGLVVGTGSHRYRYVQDWAKLPAGWEFKDAAAVAVDSKDRVYVFSRGGHPVTVFDRDGNLLSSWGEGIFKNPHGLSMGPDDALYCTDDGDHTVRKCTLEGKVLLTIGIPGRPSKPLSGIPFNRCTHTALSPKGEIYVSDGYQNASVHKFTPDGKLIKSWGESGSDPGQFNIPHNVVCDDEGWVYVADREAHRIQVFDPDGKYETHFGDLHRPCALGLGPGKAPLCYIGEVIPTAGPNKLFPNLGGAVKIATMDHNKLTVHARIGTPLPSNDPGAYVAPHGIAADSRGDVYVAEVSYTAWPNVFGTAVPPGLRSLSKLVRI